MRRAIKIKSPSTRVPLRKALESVAAAHRSFPAWIEADESGVAFSAKASVTPRVRDALVLRTVSKGKSFSAKGGNDVHGAR